MSYSVEEFRNINHHTQLPDELVPEIESCIQSAFGGNITSDDAKHHMTGAQVLVALGSQVSEKALGFTSTGLGTARDILENEDYSDTPGVYFAGAAIRKNLQGTGVYKELNARRMALLDEHGLDMVFTRTQNPRVEEGITKAIEDLCSRRSYAGYHIARIVSPGAYGKMLTAEKPTGRTVNYDSLDYSAGDAVVISWRIIE